MDLRLLGPIEVRLEDRPIELGPRKQRALLAMLALQVGRTVTADRLVEGLWGEEPPASAPKMVQLYVSHLRPLLEGSGARIVTRNGGYELQLSGDEVDVVRFERLLDESRAREALALWRGDALADLAGEPFAAAEIRRLDDLRLRAAESAIEVDLAAGRHAEVIGELERLVTRSRCASACTRSACSPCTAPAGRPRRSRPTATPARRSSSRSASSPGGAAPAAGRDPRPGPGARRPRRGRRGAAAAPLRPPPRGPRLLLLVAAPSSSSPA